MMPGSVETVASLTLVLLALTLPLPATSRCSFASARPHPNGYCGTALARLHRNFCFLLRMQYPSLFAMVKRSHHLPARHRHARSLNIPLSVLAQIDIDHPGSLKNPQAPEDLSSYSDLYGSEVEDNANFQGFLHVLRKRSSRHKRDLVCDCCYSACREERLAQYC